MSIIKKILLILPIIFIGFYSQSAADEVKKIGKYKDWESMVITETSGKVCFAQSSPILQSPKSNNKRDAKLFISFRPNDKIINEVSVTAGYEFNSNTVTAQSGKNKFKFDIKEQGFAWIADTKIELKGDDAESFQKFIDAIEELDDVQNVYTNAEYEQNLS